MTESELVALVEEKDPADLTAEEIAALRAAVATSPTVARAVRERVAFDECLFHALGRPNLSAERILARARRDAARGGGRGRGFGLALAVGVLLGVAALAWLPGRVARRVATRDDAATTPAIAAGAESASESESVEVAARTEEPGIPLPPAGAGAEPAPPAGEPAAPASAPPPAADERVRSPAGEATPGTVDPDLVALAERAPDEVLLPIPVPGRQQPSQAELLRWLEPVPEAPGGKPRGDLSVGNFAGLYRLRPPLVAGTALRITIHDLRRLRIHAWSGTAGAMLASYQWLNPNCAPWAGFLTTRKDSTPLAASHVLAARDDGRAWRGGGRVGSPLPAVLDLRHEDGLLTLSHGDVRWLDVPLADRPTEIYLELAVGRPQRLEMIPAVPLPPLPAVATERARVPLQAAAGAEWLGTPPPESGAALADAADGRVTFTAADNKQPVAPLVRLPPVTGPREVVVRVESADVGTGIALGNPEGQILQVFAVRAAQHDKSQRLLLPTSVGDNGLEADAQHEKGMFAFMGAGTWLKVVERSGWLSGFTSPDGVHWALMLEGPSAVPGPLASIGPWAVAHPSRRSITIGSVAVGSFPRLAAAAEPDMLRELANRCPADRAIEILEETWRRSRAAGIEPAVGLELLDEIATVAPVWNDHVAAPRVLGWYADLGRSLQAGGDPHPFTAVARRQQVAPLQCGHVYGFFPAELARSEACAHVVARRWDDLNAVGRRVVSFNLAWTPQPLPFFEWAARARRTTRVDAWRHPLDVALDKEAGRVVDEIRSALAEDDVRRGCETIVAARAGGSLGLVADSSDADLALSLPTLVNGLLEQVSRLRETMRAAFAGPAEIRLRQALDSDDAAALEAVTLQYPGTPQAAEAHVLLGDRSLAAGRFALARGHYRSAAAADADAGGGRRGAATAIAAALDGAPLPARPEGAAAAAPITVDAAALPAAAWHALAEEIRAARQATQPVNRCGAPLTAADALPPAGVSEVVRRARMEGDVGTNPGGVPPGYTAPGGPPSDIVDWVARQTAVAPAGPRFIVSNRFQVASHDATTGAVQWRTGLGGEAAATHAWPGHAMRPVVTGSQVFVRRLTKSGPCLAALRLADGGLAWQTKPARERWVVASDPVLDDQVIHAITASPGISGWQLWLASFSSLTGELLVERDLFANRASAESVDELGAMCQLVPVDESLVVVAAGGVGCVDPTGRLRWVRREPWIPPVVDPSWLRQAQEPPLVHAGTLLVVQPAAPAVVALDVASGHVKWTHTFDDVHRAAGLVQAGDRRLLVVQRRDGLTALDAVSGEPAWRAELPGLLDGCLVSPTSGILATVHEAVPGKPTRVPALVWLDGVSGAVRHRAALAALESPLPRVGPMFAAGGKNWLFAGAGPTDATRTICEWMAGGAPAQPPPP